MAHFAKIENNVVTQVIVVNNEDCGGGQFPQSEPYGQAYIAEIGLDGHWLQTSYNSNFRGKFAGIGDVYDPTTDIFDVSDEAKAKIMAHEAQLKKRAEILAALSVAANLDPDDVAAALLS